MTNEEKILEILTQMQTAQLQTNDQLTKLEADVSGLKADVSGLKADVSSLKAGQERLEADVSGIKVRLDIEVQEQFDRIVDGQDLLDRKVSRVEDLAEKTQEKVEVIHAVVAQHSRDIVELKKVQ